MKKLKIVLVALVLLVAAVALYNIDLIRIGFKLDDKIENIQLREDKIETITLVNIGNGDREYLSSAINSIAACNPKVIAADMFFLETKGKNQDSKLASAIKNSNCILAIKGFGDGQFAEPHFLFKRYCAGTGIAQSFNHFGLSISYKPVRIMNDVKKTELSHFSLAVMQIYDSAKTENFKKKLKVDQEYYIEYQATRRNFKMYDYKDTDFNCTDIEGKIVLMGYLGPTNEDKFKTPIGLMGTKGKYNANTGDMYGPIIIANQILMIIDELTLDEY